MQKPGTHSASNGHISPLTGSTLRVLITHELFPPDIAGGGEWHVLQTARYLQARGVEVHVLTTGNPAHRQFEEIPVTRLPIHRYRMNLAARTIAATARDFDLIHTFNYHACMASRVAGHWTGKPVVCSFLGVFDKTWLDMKGQVLGRFWRAWERKLARQRFDRTIFLSEYSRDVAVSMGANRRLAVVSPPGFDGEEYRPADVKDDVVLFVGKFEARKGIRDVLAAAHALPCVRFRMVGWGPQYKTLCREAPPNLEVVDGLENGLALRQEFARARIFLLPSRAEGFPKALLEAMASGCAIICTLPFAFKGAQVPPGDRKRLIGSIRELWDDRDGCATMGRHNTKLVRDYTWDNHVKALLNVYSDVLCEQRGNFG